MLFVNLCLIIPPLHYLGRRPLVVAKLAATSARKKELEDSTARFAAVMARFDMLMQAPPPVQTPVLYAPSFPTPSQSMPMPLPQQNPVYQITPALMCK